MVDYYKAIERVEKVSRRSLGGTNPFTTLSMKRCTDIEALEAEWTESLGWECILWGWPFLKKRKPIPRWSRSCLGSDIIICNESGVNDYILQTPMEWIKSGEGGECVSNSHRSFTMGHPSSTETSLAILGLQNFYIRIILRISIFERRWGTTTIPSMILRFPRRP